MDLAFNILSRLPAKMLLELRCVCKAWNNVIQDPDFAKLHLRTSGKSFENLNLISIGEQEQLHLLDFNLLNKAIQINHPLKSGQRFDCVFGGSCNGLICFANGEKIFLWNPLTGHHQKIPIPEYQSPKDCGVSEYFIHGFGYDSVGDDYKILRIIELYSFSYYDFTVESDSDSEIDFAGGSVVHVFSLKTKSWRRIQSSDYVLCYLCEGIHSYGSLYWVARQRHNLDSTSYVILAFDLRSEKFRVVPQPSYEDIHFKMTLDVLGGSLCVLCHYPNYGADIWVMENSKTGSWQKLISICQPKPIKDFEYIRPLAYSRNGCELLLLVDYEKLIWFNLQKKAIRRVNVTDLPSSVSLEIFSGSLIDPNNLTNGSGSFPRQDKQSDLIKRSLASLPKKLLSHIFSRLPVNTLLQTQRVCKTFYNLINDPEFVKSHLDLSIKCKRGLSLMLSGEKFVSLDFQPLDKAIEIKHPVLCSEGFTNMVGSANGLVCLNKDKEFALWNPWTGKFERVRSVRFQLRLSPDAFHCVINGFGYDRISDDYKIVCMLEQHSRLKGGRVQSEVQVYSSKTKHWKSISFPSFMACSPSSGVLASGKLHWVGRRIPDLFSGSNVVVAFDLGTEKCEFLTQPSYVDTDFEMSLGVLEDNLCLICRYPKQSVDIFVMTENYGSGSWAKLASILRCNVRTHFEYVKPLAYSEDGTEVLFEQDNEKLLWYNLRKKTVKYVEIRGLPRVFETIMCMRSLVHVGISAKNYNVMDELSSNESKQQRDTKKRDGFLANGFKLKL